MNPKKVPKVSFFRVQQCNPLIPQHKTLDNGWPYSLEHSVSHKILQIWRIELIPQILYKTEKNNFIFPYGRFRFRMKDWKFGNWLQNLLVPNEFQFILTFSKVNKTKGTKTFRELLQFSKPFRLFRLETASYQLNHKNSKMIILSTTPKRL